MSVSPHHIQPDIHSTSASSSVATSPAKSPDILPVDAARRHKHRHSDVPQVLSGQAYLVEGRPKTQQDAYPARPQSALVRGFAPYQQISSAHLSPGPRRTSVPQSLPSPLSPSLSSGTFERYIKSENPSLSMQSSRNNKLDEISPQPSTDKPIIYHHSSRQPSIQLKQTPSSPVQAFTSYSLSDSSHEEEDSDPTARQTCRSLLHVAFFAAPLSVAILFYTIVVLISSLIISPLRLCLKSQRPLASQISSRLLGPLNLQRRCVYVAPIVPPSSRSSSSSRTPLSSNDASEDQSADVDYSSVPTGALITIHLAAPIISLLLAVCAWIMAVAWGLSAMVSDERAGDDRDERRLAQCLVDYWAIWLDWGMDMSPKEQASKDGRGRSRARPEMSMV